MIGGRPVLFWFVLCAVLLSQICGAHSGGTDRAGGHFDRRAGTYHFHHGHGPHLHIGGTCDYAMYKSIGFYQDTASQTEIQENDIRKYTWGWKLLAATVIGSFLTGYFMHWWKRTSLRAD